MRGKRKPGGPKKTWKLQVEKESESVGLEKKETMNRARWRVRVREFAARVSRASTPSPFMEIKIGFMMMMMKVQMYKDKHLASHIKKYICRGAWRKALHDF